MLAERSPIFKFAFVLLFCVGRLDGQEAALHRIRPSGVDGALLLCGKSVPAASRTKFAEVAGSVKTTVVTLPIRADAAGTVVPGARVGSATTVTNEFALGLSGSGIVGIAIEDNAALLLHDRTMRVFGAGKVVVSLAAGADRPARTMELKTGSLADFTTLRRAAQARTQPAFPPKEAAIPDVPDGSLLIVGGGGMPADVTRKFIDLAGGPDALIVVLPISMPDPVPINSGRFLKRAGAKNVAVVGARELTAVESPENLALLRKAGGVWFDGGRQWRFVDAYEGTKFEVELHNVLRRGGVIGGSSAGASIQGDYLCRGDPLGPNPIMCEGYERGLRFLPGVAIDQHFSQRKRFGDMTRLVNTYPQLLGIGLDEATAIVVKKNVAEVMGRGRVHFYNRKKQLPAGGPDYEAIVAGTRYDLKARQTVPAATAVAADPGLFLEALPARNIGPANMGGRIVDVEVVAGNARTIYVAAATGGVWKSIDAGERWQPVFEREGTASVGDVAISASHPNVVWVGTGEANARNSVSSGDGVYKSTDGGRTWEHMGLAETHHIGRIVIHPQNPDIVYVAALGHLWGPNPQRGLYKTINGGKTWTHAKYINDRTGFIDVAMDPSDPDTLYAATYHVQRDGFSGGNPRVQTGPNTGLFKSTNGGVAWTKMSAGLPQQPLGRCGFSIYRKNPNVVYAVIQTDQTTITVAGQAEKENSAAATGGVFRSDDKGKTWRKLNDLCPRPFYYGQIRVDPNDDNRVYVLGLSFHVSIDGGKTFPPNLVSRGMHSDHHALWINPADSNHMICGNDGGLYFSKDRAKTWEAIRKMPLGQFYAVGVDMRTPYRVYGGLQDNGSWGGPSATQRSDGITTADWRRVAGADGFYCQIDPSDPNTVYAEGQYGRLQRITLKGDKPESKRIQPQPPDKTTPAYRFNWNSPVLLSPHNPKTLYFGGNFLFRSVDRGDTWNIISPDLSRGRPEPDASTGHTITAIAESPVQAGLLWVGTDDGRLHLSRDGGNTWSDLSERIPGMPRDRWISRIECSHFDAATAYLTIDRHRNDDLRPYIFKTTTYGATWQPLANNLPADEPVHVVRESSKNRNLLFLGTDKGLYVTLDGGAEWHPYRGLPTVPVHDVVIHPRERELVIATHGRSMYVLDSAPLEELTLAVRESAMHLFAVRRALRFEPRNLAEPSRNYVAPNPPYGAVIHYYLRALQQQPITVTISDAKGQKVATLNGRPEAGLHRVVWNLRGTGDNAPLVEPGEYTVTLRGGEKTLTQKVKVEMR